MNRRLSAPFTACLLLFGLTLPAPATAVKSDCAKVGGSAQGTAISPNMFRVAFTGTFSATATATLLEQTQGATARSAPRPRTSLRSMTAPATATGSVRRARTAS